jgi:3-oxoacyl-[acyl-carrier-protein] synthase III
MNAKITALSIYTPEQILDNQYFERIVNTSGEWIVTRTGIQQRRMAGEGEFTEQMAIKAVKQLLADYTLTLEDVDFIIVSTSSQDHIIPSIASQVQSYFGIRDAGAFDLAAACAGFVYGLNIAQSMDKPGTCRQILVIASENLTRFTDYTDRSTCILFGDGAGAALVELSETAGILKPIFGTDGDYGKDLYVSSLATTINGTGVTPNNKIFQNGKTIYKWATGNIPVYFEKLLNINSLSQDEIDWFVPHSANLRMIEYICKKTGFPMEKTLESVQYYGNTSAVSIPLAIGNGLKSGKIREGNKLLLIGFGGGLTYAGNIIQW